MKKAGYFAVFLFLLALCACTPPSGVGQAQGQTPGPAASAFVRDKRLDNDKTIYPGVSIGGVAVGDMTREQAAGAIAAHADTQCKKAVLQLKLGKEAFPLDASVLRPQVDVNAAVEQAFEVGRKGINQQRLSEIEQAASQGIDVPLRLVFMPDDSALDKALSTIASGAARDPVDAKLAFDGKKSGDERFIITEDIPGRTVDQQALAALVRDRLGANNLEPIEIPVKESPAKLTGDMLRACRHRVSAFSTNLLDGKARDNNISRCAAALSGTVVMPGQTFSVNKITGPRSEENGYSNANTIVGGRIVQEPGGGVCQVAGTLYNAVLMADLPIVERHNHSLISRYIPPGLDATLVYGLKDFRFKNNRDTPVVVVSIFDAERRKLTFEIWGKPLPDGMTIRTTSEVVDSIPVPDGYNVKVDTSLPEGHVEVYVKARTGTKSVSYKVYCDAAGKEIKREILTRDTYPPTKLTYLVGPNTRVGKQ
nr:VanW family protein [bacterium]